MNKPNQDKQSLIGGIEEDILVEEIQDDISNDDGMMVMEWNDHQR